MLACANGLVGASAAMQQVERDIDLAAQTDAKVLLTGESGVGKEVVAHLIHQRSRRSGRPFTVINCVGMPDTLLECEMFGHVRGSFTGAYRNRVGLLRAAHGGTILLDEVGDMSARMQTLLLRFLDTGEIQRIGAVGPAEVVNVRVLAATHQCLADHVAASEFRADLYYRLNVLHLPIPPLRERAEDIPVLLEHFLVVFAEHYGKPAPRVSAEAAARLAAYHWPGNVRELRNLTERLVVRCLVDEIDLQDLPAEVLGGACPTPGPPTPFDRMSIVNAMLDRMVKDRESFWDVVHGPFMSRDLTRSDLRMIIRWGLKEAHRRQPNRTFCARPSDSTTGYRILADFFNLPRGDCERFMDFLRQHDCYVPPNIGAA